MLLEFEIGELKKPKGHAMVYFRLENEPNEILAAYIIVLPVTLDFSKYIPPFLASQLSEFNSKDASAFSLPPVPEKIGTYEKVLQIVEHRKDDLIFGGTINENAVSELMELMTNIVKEYSNSYENSFYGNQIQITSEKEDPLNVNNVLYTLMNDKDKLGELSKMIGKIRFALQINDNLLLKEIEQEMKDLSELLPESFNVKQIVKSSRDKSEKGTSLTRLYIDRCYKLVDGLTQDVEIIDKKIKDIEENV